MKLSVKLYLSATVLCFFSTQLYAQTTYVSQDFSSSSTVSDYVSATPSSGQFNAISNSAGTVAISGGQLGFTRTSTSGSGIIARTTDFSPEPQILKVQFDLTVDSSSAAQTSAATLQIGQGFTTSTAVPANSTIHSKLGINFTGTDGEFSLRNIGGSSSSAVFSGQQTVTWYINNSGSTYTYTAPDGSTETLANDAADVFVGTTRVFNDIAATTGTVALTDFKFVFNGGSGSALGGLRLDNISITSPADAPLPVELLRWDVSFKNNGVELQWETASETDNAGFEILRADNEYDFKRIASFQTEQSLTGLGTSATGKKYSYSDASEFLKAGQQYWYKLVDVDFDGSRTEHQAKGILIETAPDDVFKSSIRLSPNPVQGGLAVEFSLEEAQNVTVIMSDITGKNIATIVENKPFNAGSSEILFSTAMLAPGMYNVIVKTSRNISIHAVSVLR